MHTPPLSPMSNREPCQIGEVKIHPDAVIAPGVLLYAEAESEIVIEAGVCIGMGTVLHASGGPLVIHSGASLGTKVLLIGAGTVGSGACIGAASTLINPDLQIDQVLPPNSLVGDDSRQVDLERVEPEVTEDPWQEQIATPADGDDHPEPEATESLATVLKVQAEIASPEMPTAAPEANLAESESSESSTLSESVAETSLAPATNGKVVFGQDYVRQMMGRLFPQHNLTPQSPPPESS